MDSMDQLFSLYRQKLDLLNKQLHEIIEDRQNLIAQIMQFKNENSKNVWDPKREYLVFKHLIDNAKDPNLSSLPIIALIMETQALMANSNYPRWSAAEHIQAPDASAWERMNPVLLMLINKPEYDKLNLKEEYLTQLNNLN